jgi:hypothetical protein
MFHSGAVEGVPKILLRVEGLAAFVLSVVAYREMSASWALFLILFLAPDLSFAGYSVGPRVGAILYNAAHSYVGPVALVLVGLFDRPGWLAIGLVWVSHIGFDRFLGFGLKYEQGFGYTHLGLLSAGMKRRPAGDPA